MTDAVVRPKRRPPNAGKGRVKGVPNKMTVAVKEAFELAFQSIGGEPALATWARRNRTEFYKLYARLIPVDVRATVDHTLNRLSYAEERARDAAAAPAGLAENSTVQ
jgi:hypothetical protein